MASNRPAEAGLTSVSGTFGCWLWLKNCLSRNTVDTLWMNGKYCALCQQLLVPPPHKRLKANTHQRHPTWHHHLTSGGTCKQTLAVARQPGNLFPTPGHQGMVMLPTTKRRKQQSRVSCLLPIAIFFNLDFRKLTMM